MSKLGWRLSINLKPLRNIAAMSGIDRCDKMVSYYSIPRKIWTLLRKRIFFHFLVLVLWNSGTENMFFVKFRENVIQLNKAHSSQVTNKGITAGFIISTWQYNTNNMTLSLKSHNPEKVLRLFLIEKREKLFVSSVWHNCKNQTVGLCIRDCFKF